MPGFWLLLAAVCSLSAANYPTPDNGDYILRDFRFRSGAAVPELRMHYHTLGTPRRDAHGVMRNAVLILHGTTGSGAQFLRPEFAGELFGRGQLLDATRYFIILPDNIGHGQSSKPSDGLRARFPRYGYGDMIEAQYRLLTEGLKVNHLRLVMGTSMGGMHSWLWGETHPEFMDALMPLASLPTQISGRNRAWRRMIIDAIRTDPEWLNGDYQTQPHGLRVAAEVLWFMGSNPVQRQKEAPSLAQADQVLDRYVTNGAKNLDANDVLYALESSRDYDPGPGLEKIRAPLLAINSADDLINPPELRILEHEIKRVKRGKAIVIPLSDRTRGHGTHTLAAVWKQHLAKLLRQTDTAPEPRSTDPASLGRSHFANFGTNRVHYLTAGGGAYTVVFVHCWAGNSSFWREQVPVLGDKARLILVDLPGHGLSDKPRTNYTADFFASAVVAVLRDAGIGRATLVGHSMGVPVICRVYAQAPDKVAALVAIDGQLRRPTITRDGFEQFVAPFSAPNYREHTTRFIGSLFQSPGTEALRDRVVADLLQTPQYVMSSAMAGMFDPNQPDWDVKKADVPVLVINAKNPRWTAEYESHARSLSSRTEYRTIDGVGHWLMLEKPAEFNAILVKMLRTYDLVSPVEFRSQAVGPKSGGTNR